jgi:hypothetical protein
VGERGAPSSLQYREFGRDARTLLRVEMIETAAL